MDGGPRQPLIDGLQVALALEHDVGGELDLIQAPMVVEFELLHYRTVAVGKPVQFSVQHFHPELVGQFLRLFEVGDPAEGVIQHPVFDVVFAHLARQNTVAIAVELQPEWTPRRHPQRAQPQILVDEVDVVVQAFAIVRLQVGLVSLFVVPRLIAAAWLHG